MKINKKGQTFDVIGRFHLQNAEGVNVPYCRVKFYQTGNEAVFSNDLIKSLDFEDASLLEVDSTPLEVKPLVKPEVLTAPVEVVSTVSPEDFMIKAITVNPAIEVVQAPAEPKIIAHSPEGEDIEVTDLEAFVAEHGLDMEAVENVLEGKQKTHKKWRFSRA